MNTVDNLIDLLSLEETSKNVFQGVSKTVGSPNVFGGQVLAQALNAAARTINNGRVLHSMHAYFLEAGHLEVPINYNVADVRDGGSFSVRRVTAEQKGRTIFILSSSFHKREEGHEHQIEMPPNIKNPEELLSWTEMLEQFGDAIPSRTKTFLEIDRPIEFKPVEVVNPFNKEDLPPKTNVWFKIKGDIKPMDLAVKQQILTYISDYNILAAAMNRHASKAHWGNTQTASLDHSMWYFRDFDFDDWMLYAIESPNTSNARGFAKGNIFTREGKLVASVAQEGLMRPIKK
ncbi:acyl-CoA thioesterase II [Mangrovimonas sp. AS39]|uniref:acyl-CoA thioesterase n=1 Tax=Mangrovimonas futianensis TaxID=2895523 RepID=UPI001E4B90F7|nr:acyl-CoA thioesterase II [Mangrovimonas futianensis]MCF1190917.1 acyl-CoA thioesterase II [Mangrovimonas futianensis]MCF1194613.1 acyl-CoA thioesterase II [Mangrovimonas futianensis]